MCFSANASFTAGVVLSAIGIVCIKKVQHRSQFLFAAIPLIFAVQQITEGFLWLTIRDPAYAITQHALTISFLFFAQIVWPLWVPIAILFLEKNATRKKQQKILAGIGLLVSLYLGYCLSTYPVLAQITGHHISYIQLYPLRISNVVAVFYVISILAPAFFSHIKRMWMLGTTVVISFAIAAIFYTNYLVSVWCFFASLIGLAVYAVMVEVSNLDKKITS